MSFMGGPECSTAGNPLSQFTKHTQEDKSLQRDRLVGRSPAGQFDGLRRQREVNQANEMMNGFQQQPSPNAFAMDQMRKDLPGLANGMSKSGASHWRPDYDPEQLAKMEAAFGAPQQRSFTPGFSDAEFHRFQQSQTGGPAPAAMQQPAHFQQPTGIYQGPGFAGGFGGMGMMSGMYRPAMGMQQPQTDIDTSQDKGKGRMVELDDHHWEEQFAVMEAGNKTDLDAEANEAIERELNEADRSVPSETLNGDFESVWNAVNAEREDNRRLQEEHDYDFDLSDPMGGYDDWANFDAIGTHSGFRDPQYEDYQFEPDNVFKDVGDPFAAGMQIMDEAGNLSLAALAFEVAVQRNPDHLDAWNMLGTAQAQNEKESPAIRALEQARKLDPNNLEALMGLAVSYTNEGYDATAYRTLERWLSVKYPTIISPADLSSPSDVGFTDRAALHQKVTDMFIKAAQLSPNGAQMDPDVQVGLGVLFYGSEEYAKAVDCFQSALNSSEAGTTNQRRQVHLLWNRLGATLANSGRSEEAIAAYERALAANPSFVRARYNLGVSCINIGCYNEAAQHLLGALSMHAVAQREGRERIQEVMGGGPGAVPDAELDRMINANHSTNLYETLRRVFSHMDRRDLVNLVGPGMDVEAFRKEFDF